MLDFILDHLGKIMFLGTILLIINLIYGAIAFARHSCQQRATFMNKAAHFDIFAGCMIKHKNEWIPINAYRVID